MLYEITVFLAFLLIVLRIVTILSALRIVYLKRYNEPKRLIKAFELQDFTEKILLFDYFISLLFVILFLFSC